MYALKLNEKLSNKWLAQQKKAPGQRFFVKHLEALIGEWIANWIHVLLNKQ